MVNLAALFFEVARRQPNHPAVTDGETVWTYGVMADRVGRIASSLRENGCGHGDRVVLWMENCAEMLEIMLACWTAGLCIVPVNNRLHPREIAHIIGNSRARLVMTTPGLVSEAAAVSAAQQDPAEIICVRTGRYERLIGERSIEPVAVEPADLGWIFYTSGTTGQPKGAMLSHRALVFMSICYLADVEHIGPQDTKLHMAPMSHGSGLYALPFLIRGGHQVILSGFSIEYLGDALERYSNVTLFAAPTMLTRLANSPRTADLNIQNLRTIYYGGGPMYVADLKRALGIFGPRLFQLYGQGESPMTITGLSHGLHVSPGDAPSIADRLASCGTARSGVTVKVFDDEDRELPAGEIGEVVTRSDCMMLGYWNNPEASAAALRSGWLHTGDVGSFDEHGYLTLRDRSKDMIISGGINIYPREVEEVLLRHPKLIEASVVGNPHPDWGEEVIAFVVAHSGAEVNVAELDALCLDHIARFKRPKGYRFVDTLPKNNYGKVLKTELRKLLKGETGS
ncbi:MAG: fatty-acyl-CoA synthase [Bradyrhizobium sp.]|nr:fatty-acyl-CoA synthase [Bradyrhizobium sp.]